ncbi:hypothetical protein [Limimaricola soesokkakensis]|uniref:hypothetical protein n=1 Tax=Limimaricola soesokkakensis TaxID=1343159 RepID=UPI00351854F1
MAQKKRISKPPIRPQTQPAAKLGHSECRAVDGPHDLREAQAYQNYGVVLTLQSRPQAERNAWSLRALELHEDWEPQGAAEARLAAQTTRTYSAALDCLRRTAAEELSYKGRERTFGMCRT